ncbi:MAG: nucleotidyl transferase AbiEii/AbiGii toxin family protein [Bacteroidota bacterium]
MADIKKHYPLELHDREEDLLREYLQYEILNALFDSKYALKYTFLGGTCLRIVYNTQRFSEDLDFDNVGLAQSEFEETASIIQRYLQLRGYKVKINFKYKGAFHCNIRFPGILYDYSLSGHKEAKLLIKLDTEKQGFEYERRLVRITKFSVDTEIFATPIDLLCSQKIAAALGRKRAKGRDYYDLRYLLDRTDPDLRYLSERLDIHSKDELLSRMQSRFDEVDFNKMAKDVQSFLFVAEGIEWVRNFPAYWTKRFGK